MSALDNLTALEREQLLYIVEKVPEWPQDTKCLWVSSIGYIHKDRDPESITYFDDVVGLGIDWPTYSPDFTRAQYDAMKAEMDSTDICAACKRSHDAGTTCCPDCIRRLEVECDRAAAEHDSIDYRAHCEALAGALENARAQVVAWQGEPHPYSCTIHKAVVAQIDEALTRWKEDSK